jgi:FKBP-type peptidyl-prolyl cis-trans isomerase SlyD
MVVEKDNIVTIEYSVQGETSPFLDNNEGCTTLTFQHGSGSIVAVLEKALAGMKCGDIKQVVVLPEDAYGFVDKKRIISVPKRLYKGNNNLNEGDKLPLPDGGEGIIVGKNSRYLTVDTNHPLAGQTLYCWIKIVDIKPHGDVEKRVFALPISNYCSGETGCC